MGLAVKRATAAHVDLGAGDVLRLSLRVVAGMVYAEVHGKDGVLTTACLSPDECKRLEAVVLVHAHEAEEG